MKVVATATAQSCKEKFMTTETSNTRVRATSIEGAFTSGEVSSAKMKELFNRFNNIVEALTTENGALKAPPV